MLEPAPAMAVAATLLVLGVLASKASARFGIPALLLFLAIGMLAGSDGFGAIDFDDYELAQGIGIVALAFILFSGGLSTERAAIQPVVTYGIILATLGVFVTAVIAGVVASVVLDVSLTTGLLLGAIISSTDAAAVFAVLRSRSVGLRGLLRPLLELESGSNDPMAVFLTIAFVDLLVEPGTAIVDLIPILVVQMTVGAALGYGIGKGSVIVINRLRLEYEGLYPVVLIAVVLLTFGVTALIGGSGFLAVYLAGIVMGNSSFLHKKSLMRFADGLAWLMQITMFLALGLLVFPSHLPPVALQALAISVALIVVARPLATMAILAPTKVTNREAMMVSWVGLRGAVPIVLATFPLVEGIAHAELLFNVVFFIVLTSVLVQGTTIPLVARWLGVDAPLEARRAAPLELVAPTQGSTDLHELTVDERAAAAGLQLVDLRLPAGTLVVLVTRGDDFIVPQGSTILEPGDTVLVLADDDSLPPARALIEGPPPPGGDET